LRKLPISQSYNAKKIEVSDVQVMLFLISLKMAVLLKIIKDLLNLGRSKSND